MKVEVLIFLACCLWGLAPFEAVSLGVSKIINGSTKVFKKTLIFSIMFSYASCYSMGLVFSGYLISQDESIRYYLEKLPEVDIGTAGEIVSHFLIFVFATIPFAKKFSIARCVLDFKTTTILCLMLGNVVHTYYIAILGLGFIRFLKKIMESLKKLWD